MLEQLSEWFYDPGVFWGVPVAPMEVGLRRARAWLLVRGFSCVEPERYFAIAAPQHMERKFLQRRSLRTQQLSALMPDVTAILSTSAPARC
jgi:hypothetical protein